MEVVQAKQETYHQMAMLEEGHDVVLLLLLLLLPTLPLLQRPRHGCICVKRFWIVCVSEIQTDGLLVQLIP